ncbi:MAG TPA: cupin domain-containing protein [bacterium]|nr:cupin domain-containing protein [bacterium]
MTTISKSNIYANIPASAKDEITEILAQSKSVRIERIISTGQASAQGFFYDQEENEFVIVLKGKAVIGYEDGTTTELSEGDFLNIPAHLKHRVDFTSNPTVWLAVFFA